MAKFKCVSCGLCCKAVGTNVTGARHLVKTGNEDPFIKLIASFPFKFSEDGACEKLQEDGLCSIYEDRPLICNVQKLWQAYFSKMTEQEFYDMNWTHCETLMKQNNFIIT